MVAERIDVTEKGSREIFDKLLKNPPLGSPVGCISPRGDPYEVDGKSVVAIVRADDRAEGIVEAVDLLGGFRLLVEKIEGNILIKPNCNTDDPYPRDAHPDTVRTIAKSIIDLGFPPNRIVLGETSGKSRGLPTKHTLGNLGMLDVAEDLGIEVYCFEEGEWVTVNPPDSRAWPRGIKIPRVVYEADRVILTPILRPHIAANFTMSLKLAVGMLDSIGREWLHTGRDFFEKLVELNLAYSADLIIADATKILVDKELTKSVEQGVIVASGNRVASDAVSVALMRHNAADLVSGGKLHELSQFEIAAKLGLGSAKVEDLIIRTSNIAGDPGFPDVIESLKEDLTTR
jgi:uncharacterized protein (DUF362 family)